jgi:hypothetical protein
MEDATRLAEWTCQSDRWWIPFSLSRLSLTDFSQSSKNFGDAFIVYNSIKYLSVSPEGIATLPVDLNGLLDMKKPALGYPLAGLLVLLL